MQPHSRPNPPDLFDDDFIPDLDLPAIHRALDYHVTRVLGQCPYELPGHGAGALEGFAGELPEHAADDGAQGFHDGEV